MNNSKESFYPVIASNGSGNKGWYILFCCVPAQKLVAVNS